jgi:hypothetical protein
MRPVAPRIAGLEEATVAEEQLEYRPITVAVIRYADDWQGLVTRWQPSEDERAAVMRGEDIYVEQLLPPNVRMIPMHVTIGRVPQPEGKDTPVWRQDVIALIDAAPSVEAENSRLRKAIRGILPFRAHNAHCSWHMTEFCDCGMADAADRCRAAIDVARREDR